MDLGAQYDIFAINIYNRTDACCKDKLSNFQVSVGNVSGGSDWSQNITGPALDKHNLIVEQTGRYVRIKLNTIGGALKPGGSGSVGTTCAVISKQPSATADGTSEIERTTSQCNNEGISSTKRRI